MYHKLSTEASDCLYISNPEQVVNCPTLMLSQHWLPFLHVTTCRFVVGSDEVTQETAEKYSAKGVKFVGINSNSSNIHSDDECDNVLELMNTQKCPWLHLRDDSQNVSRTHGRLGAPPFYLFDQDRKLVYTGRGIDNPKEASASTGNDLDDALSGDLAGKAIHMPIANRIGCNLKWDRTDAHWRSVKACDVVW